MQTLMDRQQKLLLKSFSHAMRRQASARRTRAVGSYGHVSSRHERLELLDARRED